MAISLIELPYEKEALAPYISASTLEFHHGKHHRAYVDNGNKLLAGTALESLTLEEIIRQTAGDSAKIGIFNNVAQAWNHTFYWKCLKPGGGGPPTGQAAERINATWGSYEKFVEELKNAGVTQFGSGWAWLVEDQGQLKITRQPTRIHPSPTGRNPC
jgi:Fe-Mn family superoxide dismutase